MTSFYYERQTVARKNNVKTAAKLKVKFSSYVFRIALLPPFNKTITKEKGKKKGQTEVPQFASHWPQPQNTDCMGFHQLFPLFVYHYGFPWEALVIKCQFVLVTNTGVMVPGIPGVEHENWRWECDALLCICSFEQCNIQNAELMKKVLEKVASYNVHVHSSLLVGVPPLIILLESQPN